MNRPCAKFITSISPKTSVRPEAIMKIRSPMVRPATVSVTQVEGARTNTKATSASAAPSANGIQSKRAPFTGAPRAGSLVSLQAQAEQPRLQGLVGGERRHGARVHDAAGVHHHHRI